MDNINKLTIEELMEIAKHPIKEVDEFKHLPPVRRFIASDKISQGDIKIPAMLIYDRYLKWTNSHKIEEVSKVKFFQELALYFTKIRSTDGYVYLMGPDGFNLSPEYLQLVNANRKRNSNGKKKKIKKEYKD
ncbi:MAG: hypothetical protein EBZ95_04810 [Chitinophagia bacterium]|nr:hypothetical protein [Chitinophagia bacterium]